MSRRPSLRPSVLTVLALACASTGCSREAGQLVSIDVLEPGEECAAGGVIVHTGTDADGDGTLGDDEIVSSEAVCNGEEPPGTLLETTELPEGDPTCAWGGVAISMGQDDGAGGGTAGDGILQPGEVDATETLCDDPPDVQIGDITPPSAAGQYLIDLSGGAGGNADGGEGGRIALGSAASLDGGEGGGLPGGHVKLFATGDTDASFTIPTAAPYLGTNPAEVTEDTVVPVFASSGEAPATPPDLEVGELYLLHRPSAFDGITDHLYIWDGVGGPEARATGLRVAAGVTLTLPCNYDVGNCTTGSSDVWTELEFEHDVHNQGTITTDVARFNYQGLRLETRGSYVGTPSSFVLMSGTADRPAYRIEIDGGQRVLTEGTMRSDGFTGMPGGGIELEGRFGVYSTGTLSARGGDHTAAGGRGGDGGSVDLSGDTGGAYHSGTIDVSGGDGADNGGQAGDVDLNGFEVRNTGTLLAEGGAATACAIAAPVFPTCAGGWGGDVDVDAVVGLWTSGPIRLNGGSITPPISGVGGFGGGLFFEVEGDSITGGPGGLHVSGDLEARGGDGYQGGVGGFLSAGVSNAAANPSPEVVFSGYTSAAVDGGSGDGGGRGGSVRLSNDCPGSEGGLILDRSAALLPPGGVVNTTHLSAAGGAGDTRYGGNGGFVALEACVEPGFDHAGGSLVLNTGDVDVSSGDGSDTSFGGSQGGSFEALAWEWVENTGEVHADGGDGGEGGDGGFIFLLTPGLLTNTAIVSATGGAGSGSAADDLPYEDGGSGGAVEMLGNPIDNAGDLLLAGGDSANAWGGDGGEASLFSFGHDTTNTGDVDVSAGTGAEGTLGAGAVFVDGVDVTGQFL